MPVLERVYACMTVRLNANVWVWYMHIHVRLCAGVYRALQAETKTDTAFNDLLIQTQTN